MRQTSRAVIIKDKKVLLVTAHEAGYYWLPGGTVEKDETFVEALYREVREELGVEVKSYESYRSYSADNRVIEVFLVEISDDIAIDNEVTGYEWYSSDDDVSIGGMFKKTILADLVSDGLVS